MPIPIEYSGSNMRRMSTISIPKQDISFDTYDFQLCQPESDIKSSFESKDLEATFCRDFVCCGMILDDLHDLLQHYEECHVTAEEEEENIFYDYEPTVKEEGLEEQGQMASLKKKAAAYLSDLYNQEETSIGKKRTYHQASLDILTQTAAKKIALSGPLLSDEEFLAQAGALLANTSHTSNEDKPYKCPVRGCDKAYKNPNGLKYHNQHGHCSLIQDEAENMSKPYQCTIGECGKRYKNLNGLKYHIEHSHMAALNQTLASFSTSLFPSPVSSLEDFY